MDTVKHNKKIAFIAALLLVFAFMLTLNTMTPLFADDYVYSLNLRTEQPITGICDIFHSIANFRSMHNGRIAAHFFAQLFLWLPKMVFNVVNAAMFTLLVYSVSRYVGMGKQKSPVVALASFAVIWLLMPGFGHSALWLTGSCSYLWAITFISLFIYPFYKRFNSGEESDFKPAAEIPAVLYAFFVGAYSENGALSALAITFCILLLIYIIERKVSVKLTMRFMAVCAGFLFLMLSPSELGSKNKDSQGTLFPLLEKMGLSIGTLAALMVLALIVLVVVLWGVLRHRRKTTGIIFAVVSVAAVALLVVLAVVDAMQATGLFSKVNSLASDIKISLLVLGASYVLLLMLALREECEMKTFLSALVLGIGAAASLAVFLVARYFPARGACVATIYITIADGILFCALSGKIAKRWSKIIAAVLAVLFAFTASAAMSDIRAVDKQFKERMELIAQTQQQGGQRLFLKPLMAESKYSAVWQGEAADYDFAMNILYGIGGITIEGTKEFE